jgi:3-deoxy-D-manno-octulosonate 8-phosphate phosphatase (KDO 8-P phosphatase)
MTNLIPVFKKIKAFAFDIDGVLTQGDVLVNEEGQMLRSVNIKDGYALQHAAKQGYAIAVISGGKSEGMRKRFEGLGVAYIYLGQEHKEAAFADFLSKTNLTANDVAYMGDDMPDIPLLKQAALSCCPKDAAVDVKEICTYISPSNGGQACVRELIERIMKIQNTWFNEDSHSW